MICDVWSRKEISGAQKLYPELILSPIEPPLLPRGDDRDWERKAIKQWRSVAADAR